MCRPRCAPLSPSTTRAAMWTRCCAPYARYRRSLAMPDLRDLYQEVILDHNRRPRNFGRLEGANRSAEGFNPLCGDQLTLYLKLVDGVIEDVRFEGTGCAISTA